MEPIGNAGETACGVLHLCLRHLLGIHLMNSTDGLELSKTCDSLPGLQIMAVFRTIPSSATHSMIAVALFN